MKVEPSLDVVRDVVARIRATGVSYIVVGGQAVHEAAVYSGTIGVDVMVAFRDYDSIIVRLKEDEKFGTPDLASWVAKYEVSTGPRHDDVTEVDVLNGKKYCGNRTADEFFDYILSGWTVPTGLGPAARIAAVWYTRLMVDNRGDAYVRKVVRDIRAGAPTGDLDDALRIADHFGTCKVLASRIARAQEILAEAGGPPASMSRE
jgi:hypothetical protein